MLYATATSLRLVVGPTVLLDTGAPPPRRPRLRLGLQTFESGGERYRAYVDDAARPRPRRASPGSRSSPASRRSRAARRTLDRRLVGLGALALLLAAARRRGSPPTWCCARCGGCARSRSSIADDEDLDRRVPDDAGPAELRSLAASFNAMLERLGRSTADRERALAATRRFAADAGHELRTPLTSVQATLDALRRHPELPDGRRAEMLGDAATEQRRMVDLLDGLQALARGDAPDAEHSDRRSRARSPTRPSSRPRRAIRTSRSTRSSRRRR